MKKKILKEARPAQTGMSINRSLFADIYEECCTNDAERMILDMIISDFFAREVFKGGEATERAIAKLTGLSKSGVRVVTDRAMKKVKKGLQKKGIRSASDVLDTGSSRQAGDSGGVDG